MKVSRAENGISYPADQAATLNAGALRDLQPFDRRDVGSSYFEPPKR